MSSKFRRVHVQASSSLAEKWGSADILAEGYVPFPKKLLRTLAEVFNGDENMQELAALLAIVDFNRLNLVKNPTNDYLAFMAGLSDEDFSKAICNLMSDGLLAEGCVDGPEDPGAYDFSPLVEKVCDLTST